jgi:hypothetical protein
VIHAWAEGVEQFSPKALSRNAHRNAEGIVVGDEDRVPEVLGDQREDLSGGPRISVSRGEQYGSTHPARDP